VALCRARNPLFATLVRRAALQLALALPDPSAFPPPLPAAAAPTGARALDARSWMLPARGAAPSVSLGPAPPSGAAALHVDRAGSSGAHRPLATVLAEWQSSRGMIAVRDFGAMLDSAGRSEAGPSSVGSLALATLRPTPPGPQPASLSRWLTTAGVAPAAHRCGRGAGKVARGVFGSAQRIGA
jgi:hypothetical protein